MSSHSAPVGNHRRRMLLLAIAAEAKPAGALMTMRSESAARARDASRPRGGAASLARSLPLPPRALCSANSPRNWPWRPLWDRGGKVWGANNARRKGRRPRVALPCPHDERRHGGSGQPSQEVRHRCDARVCLRSLLGGQGLTRLLSLVCVCAFSSPPVRALRSSSGATSTSSARGSAGRTDRR